MSSTSTDLSTVHTADLEPAALQAVRLLLEATFDDLTMADVEHALGGLHVLVREDGELVGHAAVVQRSVHVGAQPVRCGYVEAMAVRPDRQRRGFGTAIMQRVNEIVRVAYEIGALGATDEAMPLYRASGWQQWTGRAYVRTTDGLRRTPEDEDCLFVLPVAGPVDLGADLSCDDRGGDAW